MIPNLKLPKSLYYFDFHPKELNQKDTVILIQFGFRFVFFQSSTIYTSICGHVFLIEEH